MENVYDLQIARIKQKLPQTPGVWLYPPASIDQVENAERNHGVEFPVTYRRFLLEIGDGGWLWTWPLFPLTKSLSLVEKKLSGAFPFTGNFAVDEQMENSLMDENLEVHFDGALPIFYFGCTHSDFLVMNGPYAGTIMYDGRGTDQGYIPYTQAAHATTKLFETAASSERLSYLSWFEYKLDNGLF